MRGIVKLEEQELKQEESAGIITFYRNPESKKLYYLLLHYIGGHWDFPKGKLESGETLELAAMREVKEETGLEVKPIPNFSESFSYYFRDQQNQRVDKCVTFFVGEATSQNVKLSKEHLNFKWIETGPAIKKLTYNNAKHLLSLVNQFIEARDKSICKDG